MVLSSQIRQIYDNYGYKTMLLAASIRSPKHMVECALALAPPVLAAVWFGPPWSDILILLSACVLLWEWLRLTGLAGLAAAFAGVTQATLPATG